MIFNFDKSTGQWTSNITKFATNIKDSLAKAFTKTTTGFGNTILDNLLQQANPEQNINQFVSENQEALSKITLPQSFVNFFTGADKQVATVGDALASAEQNAFSFTNALSGLGQIGGTVLSTLGTMGAVMLATWAAGEIIKGIDNFIRREEIAIEKGKEAANTIKDLKEGFDTKETFVDDNLERYLKLREGTATTEFGGLTNVSLNNEEYEEFLSLNKQISDLFPSLVSTYDANGNALVTLSGNVDTATDSFKQLLEQERMMTEYEIGEELPAAATAAAIQIKNATKEMERYTEQADAIQKVQKLVNASNDGNFNVDALDLSDYGIDADTYRFEMTYDTADAAAEKYTNLLSEAYRDAMEKAGVFLKDASESIEEYNPDTGEMTIKQKAVWELDVEPSETQEEMFKEALADNYAKLAKHDLPEEYMQSILKSQSADAEIKATWNSLVPTLLSQMNLYDSYKQLGDSTVGQQLQQIISDDISNIDYMSLTDDQKDSFKKETRAFLRETYLDPIVNAITDTNTGEISQTLMKDLSDTLNDTDKTLTQWRNDITAKSLELTHGDVIEAQNLRIALGVQYETKDGKLLWSDGESINNFSELTGLTQDELSALSKEDLELAINASISGQFDFDGKTIEELQAWINAYREELDNVKEIAKDGKLIDILNDETYQTNADGYEKALSSLTSALETLKTDGKLTAEAMRDLQEEFPNLTQFTQEEISDAALGKLGEWIGEFKDDLDTLSPEGLEQVRTYVDNLVLSFGNLDVSASEARKAIIEGFLDDLGNTPEAFDVASERAEDAMNDLISQIEASGKDVNYQLIWQLAMEDRFSDPAADLYQEYNNKELRWQVTVENQDIENEVNDIEKEISGRASRKSVNEATRSYIESTGETDLSKADKAFWNKKTEDYYEAEREYGKGSKEALAAQRDMENAYEDYQMSSDASWEETLENDAADVQDTLDKYNLRAEAYQNLVQATGADTSSQEYKDMQDAKAAYYQALTTQAQDQQSADQDTIKPYTQAIENSTTEATKLQNQIDETKNKGQRVSKEVYDALAAEYETQAESQDSIAEFWDGIAQDTSRSVKDRADAAKAAADARKEAISLRQTGRETGYMFGTDEIEEYQNALTDLQSEATKYENELNAAELKHQKTSEKTYQKLMDNGKSQIDNLKDQKKEYQNLRDTAKLLGDVDSMRKWQQEMDNVDSSIASMQSNIASWSDTMTSLVSTNAASLSSALSSAFSEIASGTGLTIDTMNELLRQFSDLQGFDVSNIFYATADGMKFNAQAAENLVEAEYQLQASNLVSAIEEQNQIIEKQSQLHTEDAQSAIDAANQKIAAYTRELSSLQALYDQQKEAFSDFQAWQTAESTANKGDRYTTIQGALENMQKAYDNGLTGTDEFKAFTSMIDEWGMNTVEAYDRNIAKIKRYFTEDASGISNFYKDAIDKGFGEETAAGMELHLPDVDEFADAMDITREMADILISRAEDYGATNTWVESSVDGMLKQKEVMEDIATEYQRLAEMKRGGATADEIANEEQKIAEMVELNKEIAENTQTVTEREGKVTAEQLHSGIARFRALQEALDKKVIDKETFNRQVQQIADETHIKLTPEWDEIDVEAMEEAFPGLEIDVTPVLKPLEEVSEGVRNEGFDSTYGKIETALTNNPELLSGVSNAFQGLDLETALGLQLRDQKYDYADNPEMQGYVELEKQLDILAEAAGLTTDEIKASLLPVLSEATTAFEQVSEQESYDLSDEKTTIFDVAKDAVQTQMQNLGDKIKEQIAEKEQREVEQEPTVNAISEAATTVVDGIVDGVVNGFTTAISTLTDALTQTNQEKETIQPIESYGTLGVGTAPAMPVQPVAQTTEQAIQLADQEQHINVVVNRDAYDSLIENVKETAEKIIDAKKGDIDTALSEIKTAAEAEKIEAQVDAKAGELGNTMPELQSQVDSQEKLKAEVDAKEGSIGNTMPGLQSLIDGMPKLEADVDAKAGAVGDVTTTLQSQIDGQEHLEVQTDAKAGSADKVIPGLQSIVDQLKHPEVEVDGKAGNVSGVEDGLQAKADGMSINAKINGKAGEISTALSSMQANADANPIQVPMVGYFAEGAETPEIEAPTVNVSADSSKVVAATEEAVAAAGSMPSETTVEINGDASGFNSTKDSVQQDLQVLDGTTVDATINATGNAQSTISSVSDELTRLNGREAVTRIITEHITRNKSDAGGQNNGGIALANGTKDKDLLSTSYNNSTLVGEENPELHISKDGGYWQLVGQDGPEFRDDIAPGDIVFNAQQTKKLLKNGHINTRGKALAGGTQKIGGLSFDGGTTPSGRSKLKTVHSNDNGPSSDKATKTTQENTKATQGNTDAQKESTEATKDNTSKLDKVKDWLSSLTDWIDNRINKLTTTVDRLTKAAELAVGYTNKNKNISQAMDTIANQKTYNMAISENGLFTTGKNGQVTGVRKGGKKNTLLYDTALGAKKYQKEADKIAKKYLNAGVFKSDKRKSKKSQETYMNKIIKKIMNGTININSYKNADVRDFISQYEEWYNKSQDMVNSTQDLVSQYKELAQTKLDNIREEFEAIASYADSISQVSAAKIGRWQQEGKLNDNAEEYKNEYRNQIAQQDSITNTYRKGAAAYYEEMQKAIKQFGAGSVEALNAQTAYNEMNKAMEDSAKTAAELREELLKLNLKPIEYAIYRLENGLQSLKDTISYKQARGTLWDTNYGSVVESSKITEQDYVNQIKTVNDTIAEVYGEIAAYEEMVKKLGYTAEDSAKRMEYQKLIDQDKQKIQQLTLSVEDLRKSIVQLRWKPFDDLQKKLDNINKDYEHIRSLFKEEEFYSDNGKGGELTSAGYANLLFLGGEIENAEKKIEGYRQALDALEKDRDNQNISVEEYEEKSRQYIENIESLVNSVQSDKDSIVNMYITSISNMNNELQDYINLRKESLDLEKAYYDYSKRLRDINKERNKTQAAMNALTGVSNLQGKAELARLREQLSEQTEERKQIKKDHEYDIMSRGYQKLADDANKSLEKATNSVKANYAQQEYIVASMLSRVTDNYQEAYSRIDQRIKATGTIVSTEADKSIAKGGEVNTFLDSMKVKADNVNQAWADFYSALTTASNNAVKQGSALSVFFNTLNTGTLTPKSNWEELLNTINSTNLDAAKLVILPFLDTIKTGIQALGMGGTEGANGGAWAEFERYISESADLDTTQIQDKLGEVRTAIKDKETAWGEFEQFVKSSVDLNTANATSVFTTFGKNLYNNSTGVWQGFLDAIKNTDVDTSKIDTAVTNTVNSLKELIKLKQQAGIDSVNDVVNDEAERQRQEEEQRRIIAEKEYQRQAFNEQMMNLENKLKTSQNRLDYIVNRIPEINNTINKWKDWKKTNTKKSQQEYADNKISEWRSKRDGLQSEKAIVESDIQKLKAEMQALENQIHALGYAKGTLGTKKDELNWTHAGEIIRRSDGAILRQLPKGTQVIPKIESENLMKWAQLDPFKSLSDGLKNTEINNAGNQSITIESLITINGNADQQTVSDLQSIAQYLCSNRQFNKNMLENITKEYKREFNKRY